MKNRIQVKINGIEYTLISTEPEEYVQKVASMVNRKMNEVTENCPQLSTAMAAVLSAINLADTCLKSEKDSERFRAQISEYAEELKHIKNELDENKQELSKLSGDYQKLQIDIAKKDTLISSLRNNSTHKQDDLTEETKENTDKVK